MTTVDVTFRVHVHTCEVDARPGDLRTLPVEVASAHLEDVTSCSKDRVLFALAAKAPA